MRLQASGLRRRGLARLSLLDAQLMLAIDDEDAGGDDDDGADQHGHARHVAEDEVGDNAAEQDRRIFERRDGGDIGMAVTFRQQDLRDAAAKPAAIR